MTELIVGVLGAGTAILLLRAFDKYNINKQQKKLEDRVTELKRDQSRLELDQSIEDRKTKDKVDAITKEQNDKPTGSDLSDWFSKRK